MIQASAQPLGFSERDGVAPVHVEVPPHAAHESLRILSCRIFTLSAIRKKYEGTASKPAICGQKTGAGENLTSKQIQTARYANMKDISTTHTCLQQSFKYRDKISCWFEEATLITGSIWLMIWVYCLHQAGRLMSFPLAVRRLIPLLALGFSLRFRLTGDARCPRLMSSACSLVPGRLPKSRSSKARRVSARDSVDATLCTSIIDPSGWSPTTTRLGETRGEKDPLYMRMSSMSRTDRIALRRAATARARSSQGQNARAPTAPPGGCDMKRGDLVF